MNTTKIIANPKRPERSAETENNDPGPLRQESTDYEKRNQSRIREFFKKKKRLPGRNEFACYAKISKDRATRELALFSRNLQRASRQTAYIDRFNSLLSENRKKFVLDVQNNGKSAAQLHPLKSSISQELRKQIDKAYFALLDHHAGKLLHLIITVPSDSEIACLAVCQNSEDVVLWFLDNLGIDRNESFYLFRWEFHEDHESNRPHVHVLLAYDKDHLAHNLKSKIHKAWMKTLDHLDAQTHCDPFINDDGSDAREKGTWIKVISDYKELEVNKFFCCYLSKTHGDGVWLKSYKKLSMLDDAPVSFTCHGGVSNALAKLVEKQSARIEIFVPGRITAQDLTLDLIEQLPPPDSKHPWKEYGRPNYSYMIGWKCRYLPEHFDLVSKQIENLAKKYELPKDFYKVCIVLTADRVCKIHHYSTKKGFGRDSSENAVPFNISDAHLHAAGKLIYQNGFGNKTNLLLADVKPLAYYLYCGEQKSRIKRHATNKSIVTAIIKIFVCHGHTSEHLFDLAIKAATAARYHKAPRRF